MKEPIAKKEYLKRLVKIRKEKSIKIGTVEDLRKRYKWLRKKLLKQLKKQKKELEKENF